MLKKLNASIRRIKVKVVRWATALEVADRRIRHHKRQKAKFHERVQSTSGPAKSQWERKRNRADEQLRAWQKRQTWLAEKHKYVQLIFKKRVRAKEKWLKAHPPDPTNQHGVVTLDGKQVAAWIAEIALRARATGLWNGYIISGWRDPVYSEELCLNMCGAPSCPGMCAGRSSNHSGSEFPAGAIDITDSTGFEAALRSMGETRLHNSLPADRPHFSNSGS
jgi:hypothetical protein